MTTAVRGSVGFSSRGRRGRKGGWRKKGGRPGGSKEVRHRGREEGVLLLRGGMSGEGRIFGVAMIKSRGG